MSLQKESEWRERFDEIEVYYGTSDTSVELSIEKAEKNAIIEFIHKEIASAVSNREKEIAEEVKGRKSKPSYGAYTTQDAKVFWEGKDAAFDEVLSILKH